ncbi:aminopeptidase N [Yeosuana aromativorans]|uniref:Aminopeptidase N n=2 Tax=Yeosuana aromativorans TaxID=288019 RepID=A0A8J3BIS3_9FLAO|nr:aminopeptidase N [Yeosuana aromativorans]
MSCDKNKEQDSLLSPGISMELANYRRQQVSNVVYNLSFSIPRNKDEAINSQLGLDLQINNLLHPLYLDFNCDSTYIKQVVVNQKQIPVNHQQEHVIIDPQYLKIGKNRIDIKFNAGELSLNRNDDYLYTLLVPDRASTLFPCFDQPNIKAHYVLDINAPKDWEVLCGSHLDAKENKGDYTSYKFKKSDLMSTYLFSFVVGDFKKVSEQLDGFKMNMLYRENDPDKIQTSVREIFKLHHQAVLFLEDYTDYKFPFQKLDFAAIPGFQYGGMEHVGAIQYRESSLFLDDNATQNQKLRRCKLIAHETTHMWFGDLVTMNWFDDVWLKEVFANFLADKITNPAFPEINHRLNFMNEHYPSAYSEDRTKGVTPIKQNLDNLKNAGTLYGNIIYDKAPIMMRQLEALLGKEAFKKGLRKYIKKFAYSNADWNDLIGILDAETKEDLKQWSEVWVNQSGRPIISDSIVYQNDRIQSFEISQHAEDGSSNVWPQVFSLGLVYKDSVKCVPIQLNKKHQTINTLRGLPKPQSIIYNYDAFGYGVFPLDGSNLNSIPNIKDDVARGYSYINLYENVLAGNIQPAKALETLTKGLSSEQEELVLNTIIGYVSSIFWDYIPHEQRAIQETTLEAILIKRLLDDDLSPSFKKTLFHLFESIAYSESGKNTLYHIWDKSLTIHNLNLNEDDYTSLACTLAVFNHPKADSILQQTLETISNPDRKKRLEFLLPSLSNNEKERDDFMLSLSKAENRDKESWVLSALQNIHHPLRQESAKKHLKMCLDLVEEIQRTGDIFFPKAWLSTTIGNYSSEFAYQTLEQFLQDNPGFPEVLKNKLLQAADGVCRAKLIRDKWQ